MKIKNNFIFILIYVFLLHGSIIAQQKEQSSPDEQTEKKSFTHSVLTGIGVPLNGTLYLAWGRPVTDRLVLSSYAAFFERDWMVLLPESDQDWHSNTLYIGLMFQYFPVADVGKYEGYFIGGDFGIANSYQTYRPKNESDVFFFPYVEFYFFGYLIPLWDGLFIDFAIGGGYAMVSPVVKIKGHVNEGDFYPLVFINLGYRW
jgi:hypothetical protein